MSKRMIQSNASVSFNAVVTFTDLLGKTHNIVCRTRTQIKQANAFLSMFKRESATVKAIASQYPVKFGKFVNKRKLISDIVAVGFTRDAAKRMLNVSI